VVADQGGKHRAVVVGVEDAHVSPRLTENASTRTSASPAAGWG
jgi:hypothetical protein